MWKKKRKVRSNLRVIQFKSYSPGSSKKEHEGSGPQALRWCCKAVFLKRTRYKIGEEKIHLLHHQLGVQLQTWKSSLGEQCHRCFIHTEMTDIPHGINAGMLLVKYN